MQLIYTAAYICIYNHHNDSKYKAFMNLQNNTTPIRNLMPEGYLPKIAELTGVGRSNISNVVRDERITSKIWPVVEKLARETNAAAYEARMSFLKYRSHFTGSSTAAA